MAGDSPFASSLACLPSFDDGPADSTPEVLHLAALGSADLRRGPGPLSRRSLDECFLAAGGHAEGGLMRSHTVANPFDVGEMLNHINSCKLAGQQQQQGQGQLARAGSAGSAGGPTTIVDGANRNLKWIQPSGARQPGQGCEDIEQGIVFADQTPSGGAILRITLLASGFIIGPSGSSVRDICRQCGSDIKSWTCEPDALCSRPTRQFRVEGTALAVAQSLDVMCDAVQRYKELCEGKYAGQSVPRVQHVSGIDFSYQPPPRNVVPFAASLKSQGSAKRQGSGSLSHKAGQHGRPPAGPSYKDVISRAAASSLPSGAPPPSEQHHGPAMSATRSSSLPIPLPRPRPCSAAPSPGPPERAPTPDAASRAASRAGATGTLSAGGGMREMGRSASSGGERHGSEEGPKVAPPAGPDIDQLPSPFGAAVEQGQEALCASSSDSSDGAEGGAGASGPAEHKKKRREAEAAQAAPPAPARTLDKDAVLRTVFAGMASPAQAAAPAPAPAQQEADPASALPPWLQQLALQQRQEQLAATAAAAQALFPTQGPLLSEFAGLMSPGMPGMGPGPRSVYAGGSQPQQQDAQGQLQAALSAMGLGPDGNTGLLGGGPIGQQGFSGASPAFTRSASGSGDRGFQGSYGACGFLDNHSLMQLAAAGLLPPALLGPGTPTPAPIPATPFPSPDVPDQRQLLAALQALSGGSPPFGTVGSPPEPPRSTPLQLHASLESPARQAPAPSSLGSPALAGLAQSSPLGLPPPAPTGMGFAGSSQVASADAPAFSTFGSPSILGQSAFPAQGEDSALMSAFAPSPPSALHLGRVSSLAFAEGPTQPPACSGAGRSLSLPLHQPCGNQPLGGQQGSWADPWADLLAAAMEGKEDGHSLQAGGSPGGVDHLVM